jgi:hypothetical protein
MLTLPTVAAHSLSVGGYPLVIIHPVTVQSLSGGDPLKVVNTPLQL